eukprot:Clim_evm84s149 gene=Clim_evmTU84s149
MSHPKPDEHGPAKLPELLLICYCWPTCMNGCGGDVQKAAKIWGHFGHGILGAGLEESSHGDHGRTIELIAMLKGKTTFWGYIDAGTTTTNLGLDQFKDKVHKWKATGVKGVFVDDFGYDYGMTRKRQNEMLDIIHDAGMPAFLNGWVVEDVLGNTRGEANPDGVRIKVREGDAYLFESFTIQVGKFTRAMTWYGKRSVARKLRAALGLNAQTFPFFGVTTSLDDGGKGTVDEDDMNRRFDYVYTAAFLDEMEAVGFGDYLFGSQSNKISLPDPANLTMCKRGLNQAGKTMRWKGELDQEGPSTFVRPLEVEGEGMCEVTIDCDRHKGEVRHK